MVSKSNRLPENGAETSRSERPDPEALPGGNNLLAYKHMLVEALNYLPKEAIQYIKDIDIKDLESLQGNLREIEKGIKSRRYKSTREKFHISDDAVSINANKARAKLSIIISMVITYKSEGTSPKKKAECVEMIHHNLGECIVALQTALNAFSHVRSLRRKGK